MSFFQKPQQTVHSTSHQSVGVETTRADIPQNSDSTSYVFYQRTQHKYEDILWLKRLGVQVDHVANSQDLETVSARRQILVEAYQPEQVEVYEEEATDSLNTQAIADSLQTQVTVVEKEQPVAVEQPATETTFSFAQYRDKLGESLNSFFGNSDVLLIAILASAVMLTFVKVFFSKYFNLLFKTIVSYSQSYKAYRDYNFVARQFYVLSNFTFFLIFTLFLYVQAEKLSISLSSMGSFANFGLILAGVIVGANVKKILLKTVGRMFMAVRVADEYWFQSTSINIVAGFIAFPLLSMQVIMGLPWAIYFNIAVWVIAGLAYMFRVLRAMKMMDAKQLSVVYMVLYFLTFEILPVLLAIKYFGIKS